MKLLQSIILIVFCVLMLAGTAVAKENALAGVKLGFAIDRGLGVVASVKQFNFFVGNDGAAVDYILKKDSLKTGLQGPVYWYLGGGVYADWDGDRGVRLPVGAEWHFAKDLDAFAALIPNLRVNHNTKFGLDAAVGVRYQF